MFYPSPTPCVLFLLMDWVDVFGDSNKANRRRGDRVLGRASGFGWLGCERWWFLCKDLVRVRWWHHIGRSGWLLGGGFGGVEVSWWRRLWKMLAWRRRKGKGWTYLSIHVFSGVQEAIAKNLWLSTPKTIEVRFEFWASILRKTIMLRGNRIGLKCKKIALLSTKREHFNLSYGIEKYY